MSVSRRVRLSTMLALASVLLAPSSVEAYLGPGGVVSGIGAFIALVEAFVASVFGFVWFPLKRLFRNLRGKSGATKTQLPVPASATTPE